MWRDPASYLQNEASIMRKWAMGRGQWKVDGRWCFVSVRTRFGVFASYQWSVDGCSMLQHQVISADQRRIHLLQINTATNNALIGVADWLQTGVCACA